MEILERLLIAHIEKMASLAVCHERPVLQLPRIRMLLRLFPTIETLPIAKRFKSFLYIGRV
jgi:hypothetical protein